LVPASIARPQAVEIANIIQWWYGSRQLAMLTAARFQVRLRMRAFLVIAVIFIASGSAAPGGSLRVTGTAGYLSEWELKGELASNEDAEFSGPLVWTHIGLCSVSGPQQKPGAIRLRMLGSGALSRIHATLWFEGMACEFSGPTSQAGRMNCPSGAGIPLTLSLE
jgi:hypothetical protein